MMNTLSGKKLKVSLYHCTSVHCTCVWNTGYPLLKKKKRKRNMEGLQKTQIKRVFELRKKYIKITWLQDK